MRSRIYRARMLNSKQWVYGYPCGSTGCVLVSEKSAVSSKAELKEKVDQIEAFDVDPETWGQFTGRHDVDGRPIFEGDIVSRSRRYWGVGFLPSEMEFILYRNDGKVDGPMTKIDKIKVVGNVFDDWEMLMGMTREEAINCSYVPTQERFAFKK